MLLPQTFAPVVASGRFLSVFTKSLMRKNAKRVTVSALIALNRPDQLRSHLALARQNGVTEVERGGAGSHGIASKISARGIRSR